MSTELVGTHSKPCAACGKLIHRHGIPNLEWIRRKYCSNECAYKMKGAHTWRRRAWKTEQSG